MTDDLKKDPEFNAAAQAMAERFAQGRVFSFCYAAIMGAAQRALDEMGRNGLTPQDGCAQIHAAVIAVEAGLMRQALGPLGVTTPQMAAHVASHQKIGDQIYEKTWKSTLSTSTNAIQLQGPRVGLVGPNGQLIT